MVLVVAAMFFRSFAETRDIDPGFRREGVLLAAYDLTGRNTGDRAARDFAGRLVTRLRALPGVEAAGFAVTLLIGLFASVFTAFFVSRVIFDVMYKQQNRPTEISI